MGLGKKLASGLKYGNFWYLNDQSTYPHVRYPHEKQSLNNWLLTIVVPLIRPYFSHVGTLHGGRLTAHNIYIKRSFLRCSHGIPTKKIPCTLHFLDAALAPGNIPRQGASSNQAINQSISINQIQSNPIQSIKSNQIKSNQIKSNQSKTGNWLLFRRGAADTSTPADQVGTHIPKGKPRIPSNFSNQFQGTRFVVLGIFGDEILQMLYEDYSKPL